MKKIITLNIALLLLLTSCLSTDIVEVEIPFEEFIVVQGTLENGIMLSGVRFTKTQSLNEPYAIENSELIGVTVHILVDDTLTIPLYYREKGVYIPHSPHRVKGGSVYELFAEYSGIKIYSKTIVPDSIVITNSQLVNDTFIMSTVKSNSAYVYGAVWENYHSNFPVTAEDFHSIVPDKKSNDEFVNVRTENVPERYLNSRLYTRVYAFDKFYREFFKSKGNNHSDFLFSNITSPNWNIESTPSGAIGLFIGFTKSGPQQVNK